MSSLALTPILQAIRTLLSVNTLDNAKKLASTVGLILIEPSGFQIVEHTTKKGKAIRGVVRTDLSYGEAKAIDEYTFKKDGGWFIREKYLGLESQAVTTQQTPTETLKNEPIAVVESDTLVSDDDNNIKALELKFKPASQKYKNPQVRLDTKEGAKLLKKTLTKLFPDTKFSVTMSRGTAYGSVSVSWVDGASYDLVDVIAQHFRGNGYDGMSDSSYNLNALNADGQIVDYGLGYVSISRGYSREFLEKLQSSFSDMLKTMIKEEGVTIKGSGDSAYFDAKENWTRDGINKAKSSHSTHKYNFVNTPQAANDEPVTADKPQEFLAGLLKYAQEKEEIFVDENNNKHRKIEKSVMGKFLPWQYNKYRELFGIARTVTITSTEEKYEGINLTGKYVSESNNYYAFSIRYEPINAEAKPAEQPTIKLPVGWTGMLNGLATKEGDEGGIVDKQYGATNEWFVIPHNKLLWPIFEGKTFTSQKDAFVAFDKAINDLKLDESKIDEKAEILEKYGFITEVHGKWKYTTQNGVYPKFTANSKESAVESAWPYYLKVPKDELKTKAEKYEDSIQSFNQDMQKRYGSLSNDEISQKIDEVSAEIKSLQAAGGREFTGNGTRRTSAATSNEAARQLGEEKMRLESYLKYREKLSQNPHQELADTLKVFGWTIEPFNNQKGDVFASKDFEVDYKDKQIKAKATLRKWLENSQTLTAYANELVLINDAKAMIDTSHFWMREFGEQRKIISDLEATLRYFLITNRDKFLQGENNVSNTSGNLESDSNTASQSNQQPRVENSNANESAESQRVVGSPVNGPDARGGGERDSGLSLSENDGTDIGARSDTGVSGKSGQRRARGSVTTNESSGSDSTNGQRSPIKRERDRSIVRTARATGTITADAKEAEQLKAEGTPTQWANAQNIEKALPYLLPEQRVDVALAEKRLIDDNKNGMLFTNGTGTGKTFTGLGVVKRFVNAGKKNILIVSMNDKIIKDFIKSAKKLALNIHQLDGITDNGKDAIVATTYANLAQNDTLGMRDWDLIIVDEAHNLMQGEKGENTNALAKLRALSGHHAGFSEWVKMRHADKDPKPIGESPETGLPIYNQDEVSAWEAFKKPLREQWQKTWAEQPKGRTKVIFLSATPFSYVKTLDWAEGYLFDFVPPADKFSNKTDAMGSAYNSGGAQERFYMSNFGYKMRTNKLTRPDSKVDVGILERKFAEKLKKEGAMSGRELSVPFDYDRKFVLISSKVGEKIDEGFNYLWDTKDKDGKSKYSDLLRAINKRFDYLARLQLLEAIKAQEAIEQIKKHLALGRKVIVFHDFNEGGTTNPFVMKGFSGDDASAVEAQYNDFKRERPDLINLKLDIPAPLVTLRKVFPNALLFNGRVAKGQRAKNADLFNSDDSGLNLMIAQSDAAATGISFHDTTGKHQRVILNIGMPTKPAKLRQTEGRIYRVGQASNAIQRYLTTGTNWERSAFAQKIAERAETVDNLAQGESAVVSIKDALVRAYESAEYFEPSLTDGVGGKAYDEENNRVMALSPFERAKTEYWVKQKVTAKRGEREGKEWYATPEPVGLFMVNLAGAHSGDDILEPSAGDGAIGRYMPSDASVTFIEPTDSLASRARMNNTNANVIVDTFENHNSSNKYDAIVMNPPFGQGGSIAIKHLIKSFEHLRDGGRVVALLPVGKMDELIAKYQDNGYFKDIYTVAEFTLPSSTFENAGTRVNTKIHVFEKHESKQDAPQGIIVKDLSHYDDISRLFDAIENISIKPRKPRLDEALAEYGIAVYPNRSKYIVTGEGLKRKDIVRALFSTFDTPNADGDYVDQYNRSKMYLQVLKREGIPTMAQFNQGLSANNLPIKYQQHNNKFNTWDGVGDMPDWVRGAIRYGGKLEDFAVEKPVYNSLDHYNSINPDYSITNIMGLIKSLANKKDDTLAGELAKAIGVQIKKPTPSEFLKGDAVASIKSGQIKPDEKGRRIPSAVNWIREWLQNNQHNGEFIHPQLGVIHLSVGGIKAAMSHKPTDLDIQAIPAIPEALPKSIVLDVSPDDEGKPIENTVIAAPIKIDDIKYHLVMRLRRDTADKTQNPRFYTFAVAVERAENENGHIPSLVAASSAEEVGQARGHDRLSGTSLMTRADPLNQVDKLTGGRSRLLNVLHKALAVKEDPKNFSAWFSNSKVVDASGNPLLVYHGSSSEEVIEKFDRLFLVSKGKKDGLDSIGTWFTDNKDRVTDYGNKKVYAAYIRLVNPLILQSFDELREYWSEVQESNPDKQVQKAYKANNHHGDSTDFVAELSAKYDGIIIKQHGDGEWKNQTAYVVFNSNQIKVINVEADSFNSAINCKCLTSMTNNCQRAYCPRKVDGKAHQAATSPHNDLAEPTDAQKLAGNYKTGKININGLAISIENPQGSTRSGVNAEDKKWSNTMQHHYGYINGTEGADGDHLDVFVVPGISEDYQGSVFIIDQVEPLTGDFDEHKIIIGAKSHKVAKEIYLANYDADWQGFGDSTELTMSEFKDWLKNGDLTRPISHEFEDRYNDIGGFNFIPAISFDDTLNAIKALIANNSEDNAQRLAMLTGLTLKQAEPDIDLDMFGEPVNQGFDLFGEPIQDGDESPVEELPRLAVVELPLDKLTLSEDVPQFKSGAESDTGVVEALGGKFDRTGVAPIQVWERTDGRLEIISGRHRTDLARRSGEKTIPAQVHKESEGFTAKQAMMLDAELNIRDGQGKVKDYVDYFTHSEISEEEAERRGLIARSIGQRAFTIASQGSEELKTLHRNDIISDQAAAEIASIAPNNAAMQAVGLRVLQEHKPLNNALNTIRAVQALTREKGQEPDTFDLFGFDDSALKEAEAMARIASRKQRQIAEQLNAIKGAVKNPKLAAKHGVVVENEADALAKVQTMTAQKARWDNWSSHADLLAEVRAELNDSHNNLGVIDGSSSNGWIGVDLDGTLAKFYGWDGIEKIGEPILVMLERVKEWLSFGFDVRIFTARAANPEAIPYIKQWCREHIGQELPITNVKDMYMAQLWDNIAVTIESNTGEIIKSEVEISD